MYNFTPTGPVGKQKITLDVIIPKLFPLNSRKYAYVYIPLQGSSKYDPAEK